ncbi:MAG: hypothetical protein AAGB04_31710 [Pseudomonadota bacterium]
MTTQTQVPTTQPKASNVPDWYVLSPRQIGRKERLERIGAAWKKDDGGICIRLSGTQIVSDDLYLYAPKSED